MMLYIKDHPDRLSTVIDSEDVRQLVNHDFADYYRAHPARSFAAQVWTNNALVAAMCMILGVTIVGTLYFLFQNVVNLGLVGGAMLGAGKAGLFWGLILPHGLLELTAVFVAAGVGLRMGWSWIAPGELPRSQSLAQAGRAAVVASHRAGRRAVRLRADRGVRDPVRSADRGPDRDRRPGRGRVPRLRDHPWPTRRAARSDRRPGRRRTRGRAAGRIARSAKSRPAAFRSR